LFQFIIGIETNVIENPIQTHLILSRLFLPRAAVKEIANELRPAVDFPATILGYSFSSDSEHLAAVGSGRGEGYMAMAVDAWLLAVR
jgi:hypothetical protein